MRKKESIGVGEALLVNFLTVYFRLQIFPQKLNKTFVC